MKSVYIKNLSIIIFIILFDQILKTWVRSHMYIGQELSIWKNYFLLHYTENNGMALGIEIGGEMGKLVLTLFRILVLGIVCYALVYLIRKKHHPGLINSLALVFGGALSNVIDSVFYGVWYNYAPLFHGRVVDMFYLPLIKSSYPSWLPFFAGKELIFFRPVFNVADAAISIGVICTLIYQKYYFKNRLEEVGTVASNNT